MVTLVSETKLTLAKLAEIAGVSTSTASRALKDNPLIKQETRSRIQALAKEHNFSINAAASRLRTQKTHVIALQNKSVKPLPKPDKSPTHRLNFQPKHLEWP